MIFKTEKQENKCVWKQEAEMKPNNAIKNNGKTSQRETETSGI